MSAISTCLVESNIFFMEGLKSLMADTDFHINKVYPDLASVLREDRSNFENNLVILGSEDSPEKIAESIKFIKGSCPESRVAVLTAHESPAHITSAFSAGADGYFLRSISPKALIASLNMIMTGEKVYPAAMLSMLVRYASNDGVQSGFSNDLLSTREVQVLKCLAAGQSNKQIARSLGITEATVKVHIKAVLRKLNLSNRTQAAVWAVNEGLINLDSGLYSLGAGQHG